MDRCSVYFAQRLSPTTTWVEHPEVWCGRNASIRSGDLLEATVNRKLFGIFPVQMREVIEVTGVYPDAVHISRGKLGTNPQEFPADFEFTLYRKTSLVEAGV